MIALTRRYRFPAAHVLQRRERFSAGGERAHLRQVRQSGRPRPRLRARADGGGPGRSRAAGSIVARERLDALVEERVLARFGHRLLNDDPAFRARVPTAENICAVIHEELARADRRRAGARLVRVRVEETRAQRLHAGRAAMSDTPDPIEHLVAQMLKELGEDPGRDGLLRTPARVARAMRFFTQGYEQDPVAILNDALFDVSYDEMVIVKDIDFYSLCEHHMLPFFGRVHVAYVPNGKVVGLSKIPRLVEMFAAASRCRSGSPRRSPRRSSACCVPKGVAVVVEAIHLCMMMRGVQQQNASAVTSSVHGVFAGGLRRRARSSWT